MSVNATDFFDNLRFPASYDPLSLYLNIILSAFLGVTYYFVVYHRSSLLSILLRLSYNEENWGRNSPEFRQAARQLSATSAVLAGISMATVAFLSPKITEHMVRSESLVGIALMLMSAVMFLWGFGMLFSGSLPTQNVRLNLEAFRRGDVLLTAGIYLWFIGLLWALSVISLLFMVLTFFAYIILFSLVNRLPR